MHHRLALDTNNLVKVKSQAIDWKHILIKITWPKKIFDLSYCCDICLQFCVRVESYYLSNIYNFHFGVKKCHFYNHLESWLDLLNNCWKLITLQSYKQNWPQGLNTNMVIIYCTLIMTEWMIHHFNQHVTADVKRYHTWL